MSSIKYNRSPADLRYSMSIRYMYLAAAKRQDTLAMDVLSIEIGMMLATRERSSSAVYLGRRS